MMPLYGFVEGDTLGLLVLAYPTWTVAELAEQVQRSASVRVEERAEVEVVYLGRVLDPRLSLGDCGIGPLDRVDVRAVVYGGGP